MNNFDGQLSLYPEICVDNFSSDIIFNIKIKCFILTHFHDDHMKNLEDFNFYRILSQNSELVKFYCSPITKKFIQTCDKYSHLTEFCTEIQTESPFIVKISNTETVTVSFCGSGHCPGSIMVFIEGQRGNVLFTGDFRLPLNCASRLPFFKAEPKPVHDLYIDMTFFKPEILHIPTREESTRTLVEFILKFLENDLKKKEDFRNLIYLKTSARIGYEYVYQEINKKTGFKIHVNELIYRIYDQLELIQACLTTDPYETPIHACIYETRKRDLAKPDLINLKKTKHENHGAKKNHIIPCTINLNQDELDFKKCLCNTNSIKIILSAMWFTDTAGINQIFIEYKPNSKDLLTPAYKPYKKIYRLCYSFHSSLEEIINFVNYLKPKKIYSIALPELCTDKIIHDYFYDSKSNFIGFHLTKSESNENSNKLLVFKQELNFKLREKLCLKKREIEIISCSTSTSNSNSSSSDEEIDKLNFGNDSDSEFSSIKSNNKNKNKNNSNNNKKTKL